MQNAPSSTAKNVALLRAAHQLIEHGGIFADPLAVPITCENAEAIIRFVQEHPAFDRLRLFAAARSRFAEDRLASAVGRGVREAVIWGAGLDTFGIRDPHSDTGLRVFEVDRNPTQQWKRACLAKANLKIPNWLSLVSVDFDQQNFVESLEAMGFERDRPAFFAWLGVVPYLSRETVLATLSLIARLTEAELVFDYGEPVEAYPAERRKGYQNMIARAASNGEPWLTFFSPQELASVLSAIGFSKVEDLAPSDIAIQYFHEQDPPQNAPGAHIVLARVR